MRLTSEAIGWTTVTATGGPFPKSANPASPFFADAPPSWNPLRRYLYR